MLRRILIALAAAAVLLITYTPQDASARGGARVGARGGAVGVRGARAARSRFAEPVVALSPCVVDATATVTGSVRRQWALLRSVPLRRGPTTAAAAATTPTATTSARAGIIRTEQRGAAELWSPSRLSEH